MGMKNIIDLPIGNTYGLLKIAEDDKGKYYMLMEDCFHSDWEEIPEYLFTALLRYYNENK